MNRLFLDGEISIAVSDAVRVCVEWIAEVEDYGHRDKGGAGCETWSSKWRARLEDLTSDGAINLDADAVDAFGLKPRVVAAVQRDIEREIERAREDV